jgi:hypothetical protein
MGVIKLLAAPIRSIVRFPLFQLAVAARGDKLCGRGPGRRRSATGPYPISSPDLAC